MKKESRGAGEKLVIYLISVAIGFLVTFLAMLVFAAISAAADLSDAFATPFASLSAAGGSLFSAFLASKKLKRRGLINGLICGGATFAVMICVSLALSDGGITLNTLFNLVIVMLSALIGGVWGVNGRNKKDYLK